MVFNLGLKAIRRAVQEQKPLEWHKNKLTASLFQGGEVEVFEWVQGHLTKFHQLPQLETLISQFPEIKELDSPEPLAYYLSLVQNRYAYNRINAANLDSQSILKANKDDTQKAAGVLEKAIADIKAQQYRTKIMDVAIDAPKMVLTQYHQALQHDSKAEFGWPYLDEMTGGGMPGDVISYVGRPAMGKAQPLTAPVLTLEGFKAMGVLKVGDKLASVDGGPSEVAAIYPQGYKPVYRLTFQDGRTAEGCGEHLWEVWYRGWEAPKVLTTLQLIAKLEKQRYQGRLSIQLFSGHWGSNEALLLEPYLLGALLGDGGFTANDPRFSSVDPEILNEVSRQLALLGCQLKHINRCDYTVTCERFSHNELKRRLKALGLWGLKSEDKSIPEQYLHADRAARVRLLRGLMDTDGTAEKTGSVTFSSSSETLAKQVQWLARSIGAKASLTVRNTKKLPSYRVVIVHSHRPELFSLSRKVSRVLKPRTTHTSHRLVLSGIEYVGELECQCIAVTHPSRLYVTEGFTVTHNTWKVLYGALHNWRRGSNLVVASMEMNILAIAQRFASMYAGTNISQLKMGAYSSQTYSKFAGGLVEMAQEKGKLYVIDGNLAASAEDIYLLASQLGAESVYIDGAYLMKHPNSRLDRFSRVAENVELMKQFSTQLEIPTFASWQLNREAAKNAKKAGQKAGLEDIGYTDAIGQISSIVLGLMQEEGIETMNQRIIDVMKGRNGEIGQFAINWLFNTMNFTQVGSENGAQQQPGELNYI